MKRRTHQKPIKPKVHVVVKWRNAPYSVDVNEQIVKVFRGTRKKAAEKYAKDQAVEHDYKYFFDVQTWEIENEI